MKLVTTVRLTGALLAGVVLSLFTATASAAAVGTPSGTPVTNLATVNYSVNAVAQTPVGSSPTGNTSGAGTPTSFLVDTKLALLVQTIDAADVAVTPGQTGAILVYKVTNNGNSTVGVNFTTIQEPNTTANPFAGGADDFDPTAIQAFVSKNNTAVYASANDTATSISQLASGASNFVFIVSNIPASQVDADVAVEALEAFEAATGAAGYGNPAGATIASDQSASAWTPGTVQTIFAETAGSDTAANSGKSTSRDAYLVKSAKLTITKTSSVISDPTGDAIKHSIPGAVMQYTITVANSGTTAATGITLADSIQAMVTAGSLAYKAASITLADPNVSGGAAQACADAGSTFGSDTCSFTAGTNTVNAVINTLTNGQTATVTFQVTIQ